MVKSRLTYRITSFTIFEVTVVLALLGVLITIVSISLNRFNEQLKLNSEVQEELNQWMLVRSNLWNTYYNSDSLQFDGSVIAVFQKKRTLYFQEADGFLMRRENQQEWESMGVALEGIQLEEEEDQKYVLFSFPLKGEVMELRFYFKTNKKNSVNQYFEGLSND